VDQDSQPGGGARTQCESASEVVTLPVAQVLASFTAWGIIDAVSTDVPTAGDATQDAVTLHTVKILSGSVPAGSAFTDARGLHDLKRFLAADSRAVAVAAYRSSPVATSVEFFVESDGEIYALGACNPRYYDGPLRAYASHKKASSQLDALEGLVTAGTSSGTWTDMSAFFSPAAPVNPTWDATSPDLRSLDEGTVPAPPTKLLQSMAQFRFVLSVPSSWAGLPANLCTKVPSVGWNDCVKFGASADGRLPMSGYYSTTEALELWAMDPGGGIANPLFKLCDVPAGATGGNVIAEVSSVDDMKSKIAAGVKMINWN
jgi:hypothetical protein